MNILKAWEEKSLPKRLDIVQILVSVVVYT